MFEIKKRLAPARLRTLLGLAGLGLLAVLGACSDSGADDALRVDLLAAEAERDLAASQRDALRGDLAAAEAERDGLRGDFDFAVAERDDLQAELDSAAEDRDELLSALDAVRAERDGLLSSGEDLNARIADLEDDLADTEDELGEARASLSDSEGRVRELLTKYDEEIRADLRAEADAEMERACGEAVRRYQDTVASSIEWSDSWSPVIARAELTAAVEECAGPGRSNAADVDTEIERACGAAVERYDRPVASVVEWKSAWSTVMSREELTAAVEECAEPQRSRSLELRAEADAEIERACGAAVERYDSPVESAIRWNNSWSPVTSEADLVADVAKCAERGRANASAVEAEIERACGAAVERYRTSVSSLIRWRSAWSSVMSRDEMVSAVEDCAEPDRSQAAERADFLDDCERISVDQVEKNPDGLEGQCFVLYGRIVQFDSNTGPCSFHANIARNNSSRWWDYDIRSTFGYEDSEILSSFVTTCPELDDIDGDDFVKIWGTVLGSHRYDTSLGGSNTVPSFKIEKVELVRKD